MPFKKNIDINRFILLISGLTLLLCQPNLYAAPNIVTISGEFAPGSILTINGSGFGTKASVQPFKSDNFENGTLGTPIIDNGWTGYRRFDQTFFFDPIYSNANPHTGTQCMLNTTPYSGSDFGGVGLKGLDSLKLYYSVWFYWEEVNDDYAQGAPVMKVMRVNSSLAGTEGDFYTPTPSFWVTERPKTRHTYAGVNPSDGSIEQVLDDLTPDSWHRMELYLELSNPAGSTNGTALMWMDGVASYDFQGITRTSSKAGWNLDNFLLPAMIDRGGQILNYYVDDVYVDTTSQRIELCTSPIWENCTTKVIQRITAWSDNEVSLEINLDAFPPGENKLYLYVVDENNAANTNGYDLLSNLPNPPSNIAAQKTN